MKVGTALIVAIFDTMFFALLIYYAAKTTTGNIGAMMGVLMFYLILVIVALAKLSGWQYVISRCIHDERKEGEDTGVDTNHEVPVTSIDPVETERRRRWFH